MNTVCPCLRDEIDAVPSGQQSDTVFILYDRSGLSPAQLGVSPVVMFIASQLNGKQSLLDIADEYARKTETEPLAPEDIQNVIQQFEEALFLKGDRFDSFFQQQSEDFTKAPIREATSAGSAYSEDMVQLSHELDDMLQAAPPPEEGDRLSEETGSRPCPAGLIAPHIDFARGSMAYAQAYSELSKRTKPKTVIIFGTAHQQMNRCFSICSKDFQTPAGLLHHDAALCKCLTETIAEFGDPAEDLFLHRNEHSIELQVLWLQHIFGNDLKIVPILCNTAHDADGNIPDADQIISNPEFNSFCSLVRKFLRDRNDLLLIASADLAHVGPRFGDNREIDTALLEETEQADRDYLASVCKISKDAGLNKLKAHNDAYHICGTGAITTLCSCLSETSALSGRLLGYHQAATPEMQQAVSFASIIYDRPTD